MSNAELLQAFGMFKQSVQEAATTSAVNDATQAMQQIKTGITDEAEQRRALTGLSEQLALRLTGVGAPASTIQTAFQAIQPQQFGSAEQMQLEGELTGSKLLKEKASGIIGERRQAARSQAEFENRLIMEREAARAQREMMMEMGKLAKKSPELKPEELQFQTNIGVANKFVSQLEEAVDKVGTWESRFGDNEMGQRLESIPYQLAITYAKIVDPNSVAREGEVEAAKKYMMDLGATSSKDRVMKQLQHMRETISEYAKTRSTVQGASGAAQPYASQQQQQQESGVRVRRLRDGRVVKVKQDANGNWSEVP